MVSHCRYFLASLIEAVFALLHAYAVPEEYYLQLELRGTRRASVITNYMSTLNPRILCTYFYTTVSRPEYLRMKMCWSKEKRGKKLKMTYNLQYETAVNQERATRSDRESYFTAIMCIKTQQFND